MSQCEVPPMSRVITAVFDGEVFRPTEPLDLPVNAEYRLTVAETESAAGDDEFPLLKYLKFARPLGVTDLAEQHDHYLYGTPKR